MGNFSSMTDCTRFCRLAALGLPMAKTCISSLGWTLTCNFTDQTGNTPGLTDQIQIPGR